VLPTARLAAPLMAVLNASAAAWPVLPAGDEGLEE
jgi:hypothetical protein